jgi:hypothetical protein
VTECLVLSPATIATIKKTMPVRVLLGDGSVINPRSFDGLSDWLASPSAGILVRTDGWSIGYPVGGIAGAYRAWPDRWAMHLVFRLPSGGDGLFFWDTRIEWLNMPELETLARIPSRSAKTSKVYTVKRNPQTGTISCDCPGWIYSKRDPRSCRHTLVFEQLMSNTPINPGFTLQTAAALRPLGAAEVDARNAAEFGTVRPATGTPVEPLRGSRTSPKANVTKVTVEAEPGVRVRSITFDDDI